MCSYWVLLELENVMVAHTLVKTLLMSEITSYASLHLLSALPGCHSPTKTVPDPIAATEASFALNSGHSVNVRLDAMAHRPLGTIGLVARRVDFDPVDAGRDCNAGAADGRPALGECREPRPLRIKDQRFRDKKQALPAFTLFSTVTMSLPSHFISGRLRPPNASGSTYQYVTNDLWPSLVQRFSYKDSV